MEGVISDIDEKSADISERLNGISTTAIEEELAMEEVGVIQPIEKEVEMEGVMKVEGVTVINPVEAVPEMIEIEGVIPDSGEQLADGQSGVEVITTASIEEVNAMEELVVVIEPEEQAEVEGVTKAERVIVVNPVVAGHNVVAMADTNEVKHHYMQEEEHIATAGIQVKDITHYIDAAGNRCTHDCMMNLAGYDPGGEEAWRFKPNYVREEERLRLKRNIAQITIINDDSEVKEEWFGYQEAFPTAQRLQRHSWDDTSIRHCKAEWLKSLGIEIDWILPAKVRRYVALLPAKVPKYAPPELGDLVLRRRFQVDKSLGMKLHTKWDGPYLLSRIAKSGVSGDLEDLKTGKVIGRYAFESLKVYSSCQGSKGVRIADG